MRRWLAVVAAVAVIPVAAPVVRAAVPVVVFEGRGFGHGVGMAQDGAYWMGRRGASTAQILNHFYPGTRLSRSGGQVRVAVLSAPGEVVVTFPDGGEVRDAPDGAQGEGFPVRVGRGGQARLGFDGQRHVVRASPAGGTAAPEPGAGRGARAAALSGDGGGPQRTGVAQPVAGQPASTTTTTLSLLPDPGRLRPPTPPVAPLPTPSTAPPPAPPAQPSRPAAAHPSTTRPLWVVPEGGGTVGVPARTARYRGVLTAVGGGDSLRLVNVVDVEQYLRGMGEVRDGSWPAAALRAQAIAARTYALRAVSAGGGELCDTQRCQVYLGAQAEYGAMDRAVSQTRGQVLMFGRTLAAAVYSANGGGVSATPEEGFGTNGGRYPYLRAAPYETSDPFRWTVTVALRDVARRLGHRGAVHSIEVTAKGPSGRAMQVTVVGPGTRRAVAAAEVRRALGLRSTFFTARLGSAATAPPPPPPDSGPLQGLPGEPAGSEAVPEPPVVDGALKADRDAGTALRAAAPAAVSVPASTRWTVLAGAVAWLLLLLVAGGCVTCRTGALPPQR